MDTIETLKKARDEIQALILGRGTKLSNDVTGWILRDMRESSEYNMPMQLAAREYPEMQHAMRDAKAAFSNFGILPDQKTVGGRLFVEKLLTVTLGRLNGMLYTLGEQESPYGDDDLLDEAESSPRAPGPKTASDEGKTQAQVKQQRKVITPLSALAQNVGKSLAAVWAKGDLKSHFEAEMRPNQVKTDQGYYFDRSAFDELTQAGAISASPNGAGRVSVTLLPQLKAI